MPNLGCVAGNAAGGSWGGIFYLRGYIEIHALADEENAIPPEEAVDRYVHEGFQDPTNSKEDRPSVFIQLYYLLIYRQNSAMIYS